MGSMDPGEDMDGSVQSGVNSASGAIKYTFTFAQRCVYVCVWTVQSRLYRTAS